MNAKLTPSKLLQATVSALLALTVLVANAQVDKPSIKVLVGFPAGAGADALARIYADTLTQTLNVTAVVDNKPGAGGLIANQALKSASPDSNTVMLTMDHQVVMLPLITKTPGFDVKKDMVPVARLVTFNVCLAVPSNSQAKTLKDFIDAAKADPKNGNFGVPAPGSQAHFAGFVVGRHFNAPLNAVPYRGAAPAVSDLLGAQVPAIIVPCDALLEHRKAGKIRILAIAADKRSAALPDVPTFDELGVKMPTDNFVAVYASASLKPDLLKQVLDATQKMFQNQATVNRFNATGMTAAYAGPDELRGIVDRGTVFWAEQVKTSKFEPQ
ncbi:MAG: tripartite tricarboxylate transporter substrate-binding protein [Burkholderiaceae bacterium]|nr:tripartite tricarboxylate transporter substrate-binding protein [Burkholderiaceae bacterium]